MLEYHHVDVFTGRPYAGNSLAVFLNQRRLTAAQMLAITQELRHFESIFLTRASDGVWTRASSTSSKNSPSPAIPRSGRRPSFIR
jgi:predicted PhzF superfamily epimerase YddE/YHI9